MKKTIANSLTNLKPTIKWSFTMAFCLVIGACTGYSPYQQQPYQQQGSQGPQNQQNANSQANNQKAPPSDPRDSQSRSSNNARDDDLRSRRDSGDACEDQSNNHRCRSQCKTVYSRADDEDECLERDIDIVQNIYDVYDSLEKGSDRSLNQIDAEDLEAFLRISFRSLTNIINREYRKNEAVDFMLWLVYNPDIAEIIYNEDEGNDFQILADLSTLIRAGDLLENDINGRQSLYQHAIDQGNAYALDYLIDYVLQTNSACRTQASTNCLDKICEIGRSVEERDRHLFKDSSIWTDFIEDEIIENSVNENGGNSGSWAKGSGANQIEDVDDLDETWAGAYTPPNNLGLCEDL